MILVKPILRLHSSLLWEQCSIQRELISGFCWSLFRFVRGLGRSFIQRRNILELHISEYSPANYLPLLHKDFPLYASPPQPTHKTSKSDLSNEPSVSLRHVHCRLVTLIKTREKDYYHFIYQVINLNSLHSRSSISSTYQLCECNYWWVCLQPVWKMVLFCCFFIPYYL